MPPPVSAWPDWAPDATPPKPLARQLLEFIRDQHAVPKSWTVDAPPTMDVVRRVATNLTGTVLAGTQAAAQTAYQQVVKARQQAIADNAVQCASELDNSGVGGPKGPVDGNASLAKRVSALEAAVKRIEDRLGGGPKSARPPAGPAPSPPKGPKKKA